MDPVLKIEPKKYGGETTIVSMRLAKEMLREIDAVAAATGRTRNDILATSLEFALEHMEIEKENEVEEYGSNH